MVYTAAFPRQKKAPWQKSAVWPGPEPGFPRRRASSATDGEWRRGRCPEAGGAPNERGKTERGTESPAVRLRLCGRTWSRRRRRSGPPASPALHPTMGRPCAAELPARSATPGPQPPWAAGDSSGPAPAAPRTAGKPSPRWPRTRTAVALRRRCRLARRQGSPALRQWGCPGGAGRRPRRATIYSAGGSPGPGSVLPRLLGLRGASRRGFHAEPVQDAANACGEGGKELLPC